MKSTSYDTEQEHTTHGVAHLDGEFVGLQLYDRLLEK